MRGLNWYIVGWLCRRARPRRFRLRAHTHMSGDRHATTRAAVRGDNLVRYDDWTSTWYLGEAAYGRGRLGSEPGGTWDARPSEDWTSIASTWGRDRTARHCKWRHVRLWLGDTFRRQAVARPGTEEALLECSVLLLLSCMRTCQATTIYTSRVAEDLRGCWYTLSVALMGDDYPDGESDAVMLPVESSWIPVQGEVSGDDVDVFRLYVTAGASLSVTAYGYGTAAPAGAEPMLELRGAGGALVDACAFAGTGALGGPAGWTPPAIEGAWYPGRARGGGCGRCGIPVAAGSTPGAAPGDGVSLPCMTVRSRRRADRLCTLGANGARSRRSA